MDREIGHHTRLRYHVLFISSSIAEYMNKGNEISKLNHTVITIKSIFLLIVVVFL